MGKINIMQTDKNVKKNIVCIQKSSATVLPAMLIGYFHISVEYLPNNK